MRETHPSIFFQGAMALPPCADRGATNGRIVSLSEQFGNEYRLLRKPSPSAYTVAAGARKRAAWGYLEKKVRGRDMGCLR